MKAQNVSVEKGASVRLALDTDQTTSVREARGLAMECLSGSVWVTLGNGGADHVLAPGERMFIEHAGLVVVQGLMPSEVMFLQEAESGTRDLLQYPAECWRTFVTTFSSARFNIDRPL